MTLGSGLAAGGICLLLGTAATAAEPSGEGPGVWTLGTLVRHSTWREWNAQQQPLLREGGPLHGVEGGWTAPWLGLQWQAGGALLSGVRAYDGQSNRGQPLRTDTDLREGSLQLAAALPLGRHWQTGLQIQPTWQQRSLRSTPLASGYREQWHWWQAQALLQGQATLGSGALALQAAYGRTLHPSLVLELPGLDRRTLRPGSGTALSLTLSHRQPLGAGWTLATGLQWQRLQFGASPAEPLTSGGQLRGGALQPRSEARHWQLQVGLAHRWP